MPALSSLPGILGANPIPNPDPNLDVRANPETSAANSGSRSAAAIPDHERYSRQVLFPGIGETGQQFLGRAHVAIVGVGATGAATASLLARAGVGHLTLIDRDFVEPSNLQRQMLFDEQDAHDALPKAEAARRHIARINSSVQVTAHIADLVPQNAPQILAADLVLDCTDNFETRYLINDVCVRDGRPWIYAAAVGAYAATMNILPRTVSQHRLDNMEVNQEDLDRAEQSCPAPAADPTACLACIFPSAPSGNIDTCDTAGILSTAVNLAASIQVTEALKYLTHQPHLMRRSLLSFDLWTPNAQGTLSRSEISNGTPRSGCDVCDRRNFRALSGEQRPHITLCGRNSVQIHQHQHPIDLAELKGRLERLGQIRDARANGLLLRFSYGAYMLTVFPDGRAMVQGTTDVALARSLYARFLGS
ncbi:MAG: ThiF family adenylyltransferase [Acidobacteriaceae bacterium]